ncbi:hypothetical protein HPTD01_279 [Halomonas sp. TD01]|nr:hypothetical protein HPTD01_279 [Halomonas sp. TD01]
MIQLIYLVIARVATPPSPAKSGLLHWMMSLECLNKIKWALIMGSH